MPKLTPETTHSGTPYKVSKQKNAAL